MADMENACERVQKMTEALYRVTELFSDKEPLKWQLRSSAIELFDILAEKEKEDFFGSGPIFELTGRIGRLLKLAYETNSFISNINFEILRREYLSLEDSIKLRIEDKKIIFSLSPADNGQNNSDNGHNGQNNVRNGHKNISNGHNKGQEKKQPIVLAPLEARIENAAVPTEHRDLLLTGLKERKRKILSLLDKSEWLSIRDICGSLPGLGEKNIQRDLLKMVDAGVLKKEGDKRWRKYCLVG